MLVAGIVAEYNPFHNGHKYHINQTRASGATHIVAVMSGSFMQRGDIALCSKWTRAQMALQNGVDLVVELPVPFAVASANTFAFGGVYLLNQLGCDMISFGCESGDIATLVDAACVLEEVERSKLFSEMLKGENCSYATARQKAVTAIFGQDRTAVMLSPNNALGIEYIRAINKIGASIIPQAVVRQQVLHDSATVGNSMASASFLREIIRGGNLVGVKKFLPENSYSTLENDVLLCKTPVSEVKISQIMLYRLRTMTLNEFALLPDVSEGLHNRLYAAAKKATSINEFYSLVKTKRYTHARIRRIAYCALLGIEKSAQKTPPSYIRVLGATRGGMEILSRAKTKAQIPIGSKFADLFKQNPQGIGLDILATDIFSLAQPVVSKCGSDFTNRIIMIN